MFHSDISFTTREKAIQFGEDAKTFLISFKDAIDFVKDKASNDSSKEQYLENAKHIVHNFKWNLITFTKLTNPRRAEESPLTPTFSNDDEKFKLAKYAYFIFTDNFANIKKIKDFDTLNREFDKVYDHLEKQTKL